MSFFDGFLLGLLLRFLFFAFGFGLLLLPSELFGGELLLFLLLFLHLGLFSNFLSLLALGFRLKGQAFPFLFHLDLEAFTLLFLNLDHAFLERLFNLFLDALFLNIFSRFGGLHGLFQAFGNFIHA